MLALYTESKLIIYSLSRVHRVTYISYLHQVSIVKLLEYFLVGRWSLIMVACSF